MHGFTFCHRDDLTKAFLYEFFPISKMVSLRNQTTSFAQREHESLYKVWERFKELLRLCPHHGLQIWMIVQAFHNRVTHAMRPLIDAAVGGTLMNKIEEEAYKAYNLFEEMAPNNYQ